MTIIFDVLGFIVFHLRSGGLRGELREVSQDGSGYLRECSRKSLIFPARLDWRYKIPRKTTIFDADVDIQRIYYQYSLSYTFKLSV